jgi:hypothetical protein
MLLYEPSSLEIVKGKRRTRPEALALLSNRTQTHIPCQTLCWIECSSDCSQHSNILSSIETPEFLVDRSSSNCFIPQRTSCECRRACQLFLSEKKTFFLLSESCSANIQKFYSLKGNSGILRILILNICYSRFYTQQRENNCRKKNYQLRFDFGSCTNRM